MNRILNKLVLNLIMLICVFFTANIVAEATYADESNQLNNEVLNYLYIEKPTMSTDESQNIVVSWDGDENTELKIGLESETGQEIVLVGEKKGDVYIFLTGRLESGHYKVSDLKINVGQGDSSLTLEEIGIQASFTVSNPTDVISDLSNESNQVTVTDTNSVNEIASAIQASVNSNGESQVAMINDIELANNKDVIIVIDPGHGGTEAGAVYNGTKEKDLNLTVAKYCKQELETYYGVKVYLTRETDINLSLQERVDIAASYNADILISLHMNASSATSAKGAEVYYPNSSYNYAVYQEGKYVAQTIQNHLVSLGLADRGIRIRNSENGTLYEDGSIADYYGLIKGAKYAGFPGLIVEHAFMSNASDFSNYLSSDAKLKTLGITNANAIVQAYGLSRVIPIGDVTSINIKSGGNTVELTWKATGNNDGYLIYAHKNGKYQYVGSSKTMNYVDKNVTIDKSYTYWIYPYVDKIGGGMAIGKSLTSATTVVEKTVAVTNLKASSVKGGVKLTWDHSFGADGYLIYGRRASGDYTYVGMTTMGNTFTDKLASKTIYNFYWVYPYHVDGTGKMIVGGTPQYTYGRAL